MRPDILASQVTFMNGKRATLGAICKSKIMALTFIIPNCKDCQRRLFELSRMPQTPDMINLAVIVDEIPDKSVDRML
ncbi:MAG: hypothetical protein P4L61_03025, partial [Candidatus Pacebacteria bacterium]|nr:hypothetical protein [Candidatus Paceibacterota bacterium]